MKVMGNQATFDLLVKLLVDKDGISKEAATEQVAAYLDVYPEFGAMKRETRMVVPNRADRRKRKE